MRRAWIVAVGLAAAAAACSNGTEPKVTSANPLADSADQVMFGVATMITDQGLLRAKLQADTAYFFDGSTRIEARHEKTTFYTTTGVENAVLTSIEGTYNQQRGTMEARKNVVVVTTDNKRLETSLLDFNQQSNIISSDSAFVLTQPTGGHARHRLHVRSEHEQLARETCDHGRRDVHAPDQRDVAVTRMRACGFAALAALAMPGVLAAQQPSTQSPAPSGQCQLVYSARDQSSPPRMSATKQPSGAYNTFIGGGVVAKCPAQNMTLISDSAEDYGDQKLLHLIGHVHYVEPRLTLDSELADYYQNDEHLVADGKVHAVLSTGTTLDGPHADYYRVAPNIRTQARMVATGRPTITIIEHDSTGKPAPPATVVANTVTMMGDSLTYASNNVVITRPDVIATGDSADMNSGTEYARLMRHPMIKARGDRPFTLTGDLIDLYGRNHTIERVISRGTAKSVSKDATLTGRHARLRDVARPAAARACVGQRSRARLQPHV